MINHFDPNMLFFVCFFFDENSCFSALLCFPLLGVAGRGHIFGQPKSGQDYLGGHAPIMMEAEAVKAGDGGSGV